MTKIETFNTLTITTGDQAGRQGGTFMRTVSPIFCAPKFCAQKILFCEHIIKTKILPLKCVFSPQTIKPCYRLGGIQVFKHRCMAEIQNIIDTSL